MSSEFWIAGAGLIFSIFVSAGGVIWKLAENKAAILEKLDDHKEQIDEELTAIRLSAYEEYKTLRKEIADGSALARREFGETVNAIREKVAQIELWTRDQLTETRHSLRGAIDMRWQIAEEKFERLDERIRQLELFEARYLGVKPGA